MQRYSVIAVFNKQENKVLMCKKKDPYKGLFNFVGGKTEENETGIDGAYRELEEETSISKNDIILTHLMDFTYLLDSCRVEVYAGKLNKAVHVKGDENELFWSDLNHNFFDWTKYAGEGNIGHIMMHIEMHKKELFK